MAELYFHLFLSLGVFCELHLAITFTAIITTSSKGKCLTKEFSLFSYLMAILCPSLSYPIHSGPSLVCLMCRSHSVNFRFFFFFFPPRRSCSMCRYRFRVFVGGGEFRILLRQHHESEPLEVYFDRIFNDFFVGMEFYEQIVCFKKELYFIFLK